MGWFLDPIVFGGDYPKIIRERVGSRLPEFEEEDIILHMSTDFIGINHYTSRYSLDVISNSSADGYFKGKFNFNFI
jgi:beta-glucosidase